MTTCFSTVSVPSTERPIRISPAFQNLPPPLIIIGMHRSGTSLVAGLLSLMGVYMDPRLGTPDSPRLINADPESRRKGYGEAEAFRLQNDALLYSAGAAWDNPTPFLEKRDQPAFTAMRLAQLQRAGAAQLETNYRSLLPQGYEGVWGWKDPRNSLTLPYWLRLFPEARVLHIQRDPKAAAKSLQLRSRMEAESNAPPPTLSARALRFLRNPHLAIGAVQRRLFPDGEQGVPAASLCDFDACLRLGAIYQRECLRYPVLGDRYLSVTFEAILASPLENLKTLAAFAGVAPSTSQLNQAVAFIDYEGSSSQKRGDTQQHLARSIV